MRYFGLYYSVLFCANQEIRYVVFGGDNDGDDEGKDDDGDE